MTCENLAKVECVGNWIREGIIIPRSHGGKGVISSVTVEFSVETETEDFLNWANFMFFPLDYKELGVVYLDINLAKVAMWLYGYLSDISISR